MRAISLWQPWASLWLSTRKVHETRHWNTDYRGLLAIHATKKLVKTIDDALLEILQDEFGGHWALDLPTGAIVGVLELIACKPILTPWSEASDDFHCGDFSLGRFAWERGAFRLLSEPLPYKGRQGFFDVPDTLLGGATVNTVAPLITDESMKQAGFAWDPSGQGYARWSHFGLSITALRQPYMNDLQWNQEKCAKVALTRARGA
jgi:activating signal cointegrator 1